MVDSAKATFAYLDDDAHQSKDDDTTITDYLYDRTLRLPQVVNDGTTSYVGGSEIDDASTMPRPHSPMGFSAEVRKHSGQTNGTVKLLLSAQTSRPCHATPL